MTQGMTLRQAEKLAKRISDDFGGDSVYVFPAARGKYHVGISGLVDTFASEAQYEAYLADWIAAVGIDWRMGRDAAS